MSTARKSTTAKSRKRKPTGAVVEAAIRKVMDEVENELPDKQDIWTDFFNHYTDLSIKEDETLTEVHLKIAASLADTALQLVEERWPMSLLD